MASNGLTRSKAIRDLQSRIKDEMDFKILIYPSIANCKCQTARSYGPDLNF